MTLNGHRPRTLAFAPAFAPALVWALAGALAWAVVTGGATGPALAEEAAPEPPAQTGEAPAAKPAGAAKTEETAREAPDLAVREDDVAGIDAATSFDPMAVRQKLPPGFAVTTGTYRGEDQELQIIHVLRDDIPVLSIYPDSQGRIGLIQVFHPRVGVGEGHIGSPFESFFSDPAEADCVRGIDQLSGMLICTMKDSRRINLLFDGSAWDGPDDAMPPAEALRSWPLKYVIWSAEAGDEAETPERPADR